MTTIKAISPIASIKAKQIKEERKSWAFKDGFLAMPRMKAPKRVPRPHPGPINDMVASPAPMNLYPNVI